MAKGLWIHTDFGADDTLSAALKVARSRDWSQIDAYAAAAYLRIIIAASWVYITLKPEQGATEVLGKIKAEDYPDKDRLFIASTLARTFGFFTDKLEPKNLDLEWKTVEGDPPEMNTPDKTESAGLPIVLIVSLAVVGAALSGFVAVQAAQVVDQYLYRSALHRELLESHAHAIQLIGSHRDAELKAGKDLPFTAQELKHFETLQERQQNANRALGNSTLPPPFKGATTRDTDVTKSQVILFGLGFLLLVLALGQKKTEPTNHG